MPRAIRRLRASPIRVCLMFYGLVWILIVIAHYPFHFDLAERPKTALLQTGESFYERAYAATTDETAAEPDDIYVQTAKRMAELFGIKEAVGKFAVDYDLSHKRVLEVGAGRGYLQDVVADYTGLDISPTARRYFHKPFVQASATDMPFASNTFDAIWTVWVLEHVPNPEQALSEMRRVLKDKGLLYLAPAWRCTTWAANGYEVRHYADLDVRGKVIKATLPVRRSPLFQLMYLYPVRFARVLETQIRGGESMFKYTRLTPSYDYYWVPDSDAVNSLDRFEAILWFKSRGDECLNCGTDLNQFLELFGPVVVRVHKQHGPGLVREDSTSVRGSARQSR